MTRARGFLVVALLAAALPSSGCGDRGPAAPAARGRATRVVRDADGVDVTLPQDVRRVVTTVPGLSATVVALGAGATLVGVSDRDPDAGALGALPRLPVYPTIPAERVAALEPDLLLVDRVLSRGDVAGLRARFPCTFVTDTSHTLDRLRESFLRVAEALGVPRRGEALADELDRARAEARVPGRPRVLVLGQVDPPPPYAIGPKGLLGDMVVAVGAENVAWDLPGPSGPLASEVVVERAPDWILHTGGTFPAALARAWASVPAVRERRVADVGGDLYMQGGPRTAEALRRLAALLSGGGGR